MPLLNCRKLIDRFDAVQPVTEIEVKRDIPTSGSDSKPQWMSRRGVLIGSGTVVAALALARWQYLKPPNHNNERLSVAEAHRRAVGNEITLIDIRTPREWRGTGVPEGAHLIDMRDPDFTDQLEQIVGARRDAPIALICARGVRSARMTLRLRKAGFTNIIDVPEGMLGSKAGPGWIRSNLPVSKWNG